MKKILILSLCCVAINGVKAQLNPISPNFSTTASPVPLTVDGVLIWQGLFKGNLNVGIGPMTLQNTTSVATLNVGIGNGSLQRLNNGSFNVAIGRVAANNTTTGSFNVAVGPRVLEANTEGSNNIAIGQSALANFSKSSSNIAIGFNAFTSTALNDGLFTENIAIGRNALGTFGSGTSNVGLGTNSFRSSSGNFNLALGFNALQNLTNIATNNPSINNIAIGINALTGISGSNNIALGQDALLNISGQNNVAIGNFATLPAGTNFGLSIQNIIYGTNSGTVTNPLTGSIGIGIIPPIAGTPTSAKLVVGNSSGLPSLRLTSVPTAVLPISNLGGVSGHYLFVDVNGIVRQAPVAGGTGLSNNCVGTANIGFVPRNLDAAGNLTCSQINDNGTTVGIGTPIAATYSYALGDNISSGGTPITVGTPYTLYVNGWTRSIGYTTLSDQRLKTDIQRIEGSLEKIAQIGGYTYLWNKNIKKEFNLDDNRQSGFLAQEIQKVLPEAVVINSDGIYGVNYNAITPLLAEGIKALQLKNENLELQVAELRNKVNQLAPNEIKFNVNNLDVVPNPVTGISTVSYKLENANAPAVLVIADLQGKLIKQIALPKNVSKGTIQVNKKDLANGLYIFSLINGNNEVQSKKVLVTE